MNRKFDLEKYETVKERKVRFYNDYPNGRIIVENATPNDQLMEFALFRVTIFLTPEDQEKNLPKSTGYAMEVRDKETKISGRGIEYESVNYTSWTENCEESAVGRALDNAGYASSPDKKPAPSRDEMEKVERNSKVLRGRNAQPKNNAEPKIAPTAKSILDKLTQKLGKEKAMEEWQGMLQSLKKKLVDLTDEDLNTINSIVEGL